MGAGPNVIDWGVGAGPNVIDWGVGVLMLLTGGSGLCYCCRPSTGGGCRS